MPGPVPRAPRSPRPACLSAAGTATARDGTAPRRESPPQCSHQRDTHQVEVLLSVQILHCEEERETVAQLGVQTETPLCRCPPRQEEFCFPQEP